MSDTIRWCFTEGWGGQHAGCTMASHDVADALVIRADQPVYRIKNDTFTATLEDEYKTQIPLTQMLINVGVLVRIGEDT